MAKGQFHIGRNGPGPCDSDPTNPRAVGCPYTKDGHYDTLVEAEAVYEKLNQTNLFGTVSKVKTVPDLSPLRIAQQKSFDELASKGIYGISFNSNRGDYVADDSESLQKFCDALQSDCDLDPYIHYDPEVEDVIRSVEIPELDLEIENQNADEDYREALEWASDRRHLDVAYWRS